MAYDKRRRKNPKYSSKKTETSGKDVKTKESPNDPDWYIRQNQLAKDVASLSFNNALGARCILNGDNAYGSLQFGAASQNIPGIMAIYASPAVNPGTNESTAINLAAKNLYTFVRHQNSGHSNYESSDLMMYIMAMDSAYAYSAWLTRLYGLLKTYSQVNRFIGMNMVYANGCDAIDLMGNLADFRAYINMYNTRLSAFCTPNTMSLFKRHWWMYSNVFADQDVAKSQTYMYVPATLWQWNETSGNPGFLEPIQIALRWTNTGFASRTTAANRHKLSQLKTIGDGILGALVGSEDINIMSGDILKAYGRENVWSIGLISEDYSVVPIYSEEILDQIHNTHFTGAIPVVMSDPTSNATVSIDSMRLTQTTNAALVDYISYNPQFTTARNLAIEHILDMAENEPTPERVLVATRNMLHGYTDTAANAIVVTTLDSCCSDICHYADIYYIDSTGALTSQTYYDMDFKTNLSLPFAALYTKFRRAPLLYLFGGANNNNIPNVIGDIGNYTVVDSSDIQKMHESALLSMLGVPA